MSLTLRAPTCQPSPSTESANCWPCLEPAPPITGFPVSRLPGIGGPIDAFRQYFWSCDCEVFLADRLSGTDRPRRTLRMDLKRITENSGNQTVGRVDGPYEARRRLVFCNDHHTVFTFSEQPADAEEPIRMRHLLGAARGECAKLGRPVSKTEVVG